MPHPTIKRLEEIEDHLDRFKKVADGLEIDDIIANKLANFIHYEIMKAKKEGYEEEANRCYEHVEKEKKEAFLSGAKAMQEAMKGEEITYDKGLELCIVKTSGHQYNCCHKRGFNSALASQREAGMKFIKSLSEGE